MARIVITEFMSAPSEACSSDSQNDVSPESTALRPSNRKRYPNAGTTGKWSTSNASTVMPPTVRNCSGF